MSKKTFRSVCAIIVIAIIASSSYAGSLPIKFSQLEDYAYSKSPESQILKQEFERIKAERGDDLAWSNPEIAYDREKVDESDEYQITIGKSFSMPWNTLNKRSAWNYRMNSAELEYKNKLAINLSELKRDYVRIRLFDEYLSRLEHLNEIFHDASNIANSRFVEGHLSGVEEHLIQMVVISLQASFQSANQERREVFNNWKTKMGLNDFDNPELTTVIEYQPIDVMKTENDLSSIENNPQYLAKMQMSKSLGKFASAEKGKIIPDINIYGGYKKVEPAYGGHVFGVSLSLPLFNRNGSKSRQYIAQRNSVDHEAKILNSQLKGRANNLIQSISEAQLVLAVFKDHFEEDQEALGNLVYSYEEGWISLSELLNAIQIELTGLKDYYDQLFNYYSNIFELETLIRKTLVEFNE